MYRCRPERKPVCRPQWIDCFFPRATLVVYTRVRATLPRVHTVVVVVSASRPLMVVVMATVVRSCDKLGAVILLTFYPTDNVKRHGPHTLTCTFDRMGKSTASLSDDSTDSSSMPVILTFSKRLDNF